MVSGSIPKDVDSNWYLNAVVFPTIRTVCGLNLIKTKSGKKIKITEAIIP